MYGKISCCSVAINTALINAHLSTSGIEYLCIFSLYSIVFLPNLLLQKVLILALLSLQFLKVLGMFYFEFPNSFSIYMYGKIS